MNQQLTEKKESHGESSDDIAIASIVKFLPMKSKVLRLTVLLCIVFCLGDFRTVADPAPPPDFSVEDVVMGLVQPIAMRFLPDGRMLLVQKQGPIRIVNVFSSPIQSDVYMDLSAASHSAGLNFDQERGVLDLAIDPAFPTSPYIYLFYTPATGPTGAKARIARFTHQENSGGISSRGSLSSEIILWQDSDVYDSCCHYGGGLSFGPDGNLWLTTGEHFQGNYAQDLKKAGGKVHRITKTGGIPAGNPYNDGAGPNVDSTFAIGLRNPFRSGWDLSSGRLYIGEVGGNDQLTAWEDLHVLKYDQASGRFVDEDFGTASDNGVYNGINFGWPTVEGRLPHTDFPGAVIDPTVGEPIFGYKHNNVTAAITGGVVYRSTQFPASYHGAYFYADSTRNFIRYLKFNTDGSVAPNPNPGPITATNPEPISYPFDLSPLGRLVSLEVGPDGSLYYVSFTESGGAYGEPNPTVLGGVRRYKYTSGNTAPTIGNYTATPSAGHKPLAVSFQFQASDFENDAMSYVVTFGDGTTTGAPQPLAPNSTKTVNHTYSADGLYQARLDVLDPLHTTSSTVPVTVGTPPTITSLTSSNPRPGSSPTMFRFGDTITFSATATDAEDGQLTGANFTWAVVFVRPGNTHPSLGPVTGTTSLNFPIPLQGQGFSGPVFYRCFLTVTDSSGISTTSSTEIYPEKVNISFDTVPSGIVVQIDGNAAVSTPYVLDTLINYNHTITVPSPACHAGVLYQFSQWSNGPLTVQQTYNVPTTDSALTAVYTSAGPCILPSVPGLVLRLECDAGVTTQTGSIVSQWNDLSGFGNNLTGSGNPVAGAVLTPSGYPAITLNGTSAKLERTATLSAFPSGNADRTMFVVTKYNSSTWWAGSVYGSGATPNQAFGLYIKHPTGELALQGGGSLNDLISTTPGIGAGWLLQEGVLNNGTAILYKNGTQIALFSHTYDTVLSKLVLGQEISGLGYVGMDVAAVLLYNRALSASERTSIENYLNAKYLQGSSTPPNSPPTVAITAPPNAASFPTGTSIDFTATANDPEQGNLSSSIQWTSNLDGPLGTGASISHVLTAGTHTVTASVTDSGNQVGSASVIVSVTSSSPGGLITLGLVLQLESDLNVTTQGGTTVAGWLDQSGLGNDLVASGSPQLGAVLTPSGRQAITLNGTSGKLERTGALGGFPAANSDRSMFLVCKYNSSSAWAGAAYGTGANNQAFGLNIKHPTGELDLQGWGGGNDLVSATPGLGAGWLIQEGILSSGTAVLYKDGIQIAQFNHAYNTFLTKFVIGQEIANLGYVGMDVAAVLLYNRALSPTERASVENYLRTKFLQSGPPINTAPTVSIIAPANNSTFASGASITFTGTANDTQDGSLNSSLQWSSNLDGPLGTGASITKNTLTVGTHTITASVTDSGGLPGNASITVIISPPGNTAPVVSITAPANNSSFASGTSITFTGTANDAEQGNLSSSIQWSSSADGPLGSGASISHVLTVGTHTVTASVTDSGSLVGSASITVIVTPPAGQLITSGLVLRLESDVSVTTSGGATVTGWADQSGSGNNVTGSGSPQLGAVLTPSGLPAITLNGTSGKLDRTSALTGLPTGNADRTIFFVVKYNSSTAWAGVAYGTGADNQAYGLNIKHPTGELGLQGWGGGNDLVSATAGIGAGWLIQEGLLSNGTSTLYKNGTQIGQFAHTYNTVLTKLVIGQEIANLGFVGIDVAAVLIYNRALNATERASVEGYLQTKFLQSGPPVNTAPTVSISAPANNSTFASGASITFTGTANDTQDGSLSSSIQWSSSKDGALGTGASITKNTLTVGTHTITASVTDSGGLPGSASITVVISPPGNTAPVVSITAPANNSSFASGTSITFTGTANDAEQGNLSSSIQWSSSVDGALGSGASISHGLTVGTHTVTASVTDSGSLVGSASITVIVTPPAGQLITSGLVLRLESDVSVTSSGGTVTGWADQSGSGNNVTGSGSPQLGAVLTPSGIPAITLNGTSGKLDRTSALTGLPTGNADRTIFFVVKYNSSTAWAGVAYGTGADNQAYGLDIKHPTGELGLQGWGGGNDLVSTTAGIGAGWLIQEGLLSNGTSTLYKNGAQIGQFAHTYNTVLSKLVIGQEIANLGFVGIDVAAVLIYNRALNATERASVEGYLQTKFLQSGPPVNTAPTVSISAPANNSTFASGASITFTGIANDTQDGSLNSSLQWSSNLDGPLGTGASITKNTLTVGTHTITASVTDSGGLPGSASITITVTPVNTAPVVAITAPANNSSFLLGASITFTGTANDAQQGNLGASIQWSSSKDGALGTGASITKNTLTVGTHTITASVTDSGGLPGSASITVVVNPPGNTTPVVAITAPANNSSFVAGASITFTGTANDTEQGNLGASIQWSSSKDGALGTGASITKTTLTLGTHTITASVTDSGGLIGSASISITVTAANTAPVVAITAPANNSSFIAGASITFTGTANDAEQGNLGASIQWSSSKDGVLGTGASITKTTLTVGTHTITASVTDSGGLVGSASITVIVTPNTTPVVAITAPANNSSFVAGASITFTGTANDTEQGNLGASIQWSSSKDGALGTGASITKTTLTVGTHTVTASVTDSGGLVGSASITVIITSNTAPIVAITAPANNSSFLSGTSITFTGTANDTEQGNLVTSIQWSSSLDGVLGTGASITKTTLTVGTHTITASVTDSGGLVGSASITVIITSNTAPVLSITAPANNATFVAGASITFTGTANDAQQGNLNSSIQWTSSRDGLLGNGASVSSPLSAGLHTITASATDNDHLTGSASITLKITSPPGLITSGLVLHLESDLSVTSNNGVVSGWVDLSGKGNDLAATGNPAIGSVLTPSTKPAISFNGTSAKLEKSSALNSIPSANADRTIFFVVKYNNAAVDAGASIGSTGNNRSFALVVRPQSGVLAIEGGGGNKNDLVSGVQGVGAGWLVQGGLLASGKSTLFKNGTSLGVFTHAYNTALSRIVIAQDLGNTGFAAMDVAALLIYNRALSTTEIANVESYLEGKYLQAPASPLGALSVSRKALPDDLAALGLEVRNGTIILRYPTLQPIGDYHLHAITNLATQSFEDPANCIEVWDKSEIELMEPWERSGIYLEYPISEKNAFFRLFIDRGQ